MNSIPLSVTETQRFKLGAYRGLEYGLILHTFGQCDAYIEGNVTQRASLRNNPGPRTVLNAIERLAANYGLDLHDTQASLAIAQGQYRDYEARIGTPFAHAEYERELADLRDRLKLGLSEKAAEADKESVAELAERIKALRAAHTVEAAPERLGTRKALRAEMPVTTRIRKQIEEFPAAEPKETSLQISTYPIIITDDEPQALASPSQPHGSINMSKAKENRRSAAPIANEEPTAEQAASTTMPSPAAREVPTESPAAKEASADEPLRIADPRPFISVSLSGYNGGPSMHLLRSQKFNQMQIRFDGEQPDEQYRSMLKQAGWRDRTEAEGVWTKQIDKNVRWQSVDKMKREFKEVAAAIRRDKGMAPLMKGLAWRKRRTPSLRRKKTGIPPANNVQGQTNFPKDTAHVHRAKVG